jgi:hypothetical protein
MFGAEEGWMTKLISLVTGSKDACGCDYALVSLTSKLADLAMRRIAMLKEQSQLDEGLVESYFWDAHAEYFALGLPNKRRTRMLWLRCSTAFLPSLVIGWRLPPSFRFRVIYGRASNAAR